MGYIKKQHKPADFGENEMPVKKARKLRDTLLITGVVIALMGQLWNVLGFLGFALMILLLIPQFLWNKCPRCGKHFGKEGRDFCQYCGKPLE